MCGTSDMKCQNEGSHHQSCGTVADYANVSKVHNAFIFKSSWKTSSTENKQFNLTAPHFRQPETSNFAISVSYVELFSNK